MPAVNVDVSKLKVPDHINLADPTFFKSSKIEILIGADIFWEVICAGQIPLGRNNPILQKTQFGWIVSGPIGVKSSSVACNFIQNDNVDTDIQKCLTKFWEVKETPLKLPRSNEENACEEHFKRYTKQDKDGRFVVTLPFKENPEKLGSSREIAIKRFMSLERKLEGDARLKKLYDDFMREYEDLNHMSRIQDTETDKSSYYMPHHGVIKNDSLTMKLRVVFDASSPTSSGLSLNNLQYVGPTLQQTLFSILLRFRQHELVVSADITKMYRQILIEPEQHRFQRILWRQKPSDTLTTYELKTVTYGTTAAS
ncbi:uncharacterized protein LOC130902952 [Diorhabda carinulata]|uniref:uncharacterized protein LOC130902917 n=2 Tax=Diorhabda carinulata TaxID=1163345 RepID=UPI0025A1C834|nr:uncharacterized protein LOC130902917 [Diorhabda carinulata]XP_057671218.1 uncharacterized protein LOC130902945 [Diorhabda carinulata]XP_057671225.1 uncharacterized protein LOC130902952 [Diorhabda carinulata]